MATTEFLKLTMDDETQRYNVSRINENTQSIDNQFQRLQTIKEVSGTEISVSDATGPSFSIENNSAVKATVLFTSPVPFEDEIDAGATATYTSYTTGAIAISFTSNVSVRLRYNAHLQTWLNSLANRSATLDRITDLETRVAALEAAIAPAAVTE